MKNVRRGGPIRRHVANGLPKAPAPNKRRVPPTLTGTVAGHRQVWNTAQLGRANLQPLLIRTDPGEGIGTCGHADERRRSETRCRGCFRKARAQRQLLR